MTEIIQFVTDEEDLSACLALRHEVFVREQGVSPADELDGMDAECLHILARIGGQPVGAARILIRDEVAKIGRVCVLPAMRGSGLGGRMLEVMLAELAEMPQMRRARLGSQIAAITLYARAGFQPVGPRYMEAGLEHQDMELSL